MRPLIRPTSVPALLDCTRPVSQDRIFHMFRHPLFASSQTRGGPESTGASFLAHTVCPG